MILFLLCFVFFFFNDTATTEIYTLSLHDALPISNDFFNISWLDKLNKLYDIISGIKKLHDANIIHKDYHGGNIFIRSEEHTSELQSRSDLVCRLLLEKKKK